MKGVNAEWHKAHRMPRNPTLEQRIEWHLEHREVCGCRPPPEGLVEELDRRKTRTDR